MAFPNPKWLLAGPQVIVKQDFIDLENEIMDQPTVRLQPPLAWVDNTTVEVEATADCPVQMQFTGMPNILNPVSQVSGSLSDGLVRGITADVSCNLGTTGLYGTTQTEKSSQWYAVFAIAADISTDFVLKAVPIMRVNSQASKTISLGNLGTPATGIGYGFTTDELAAGMIYMLSSANNRGLMRTISSNNNDNGTGGTITYTGDALTVAEGDWFIVLPPNTNFLLVGTFWNNASGHIEEFFRLGNWVWWSTELGTTATDIGACCPFATILGVSVEGNGVDIPILRPDWGMPFIGRAAAGREVFYLPIRWVEWTNENGVDPSKLGYAYPPGTGF